MDSQSKLSIQEEVMSGSDGDNREPVEMDMVDSDEEENGSRTVDQEPEMLERNGDSRQEDVQTKVDNGRDSHEPKASDARNGDTSPKREKRVDLRAGVNIVQVLNVAPTATLDQLRTLFSFFGDILNIELYHFDQNNSDNSSTTNTTSATATTTDLKVCFVEFAQPSSVTMAQHLTNTVFIDRALVVLPCCKHKIPDRSTALTIVSGSSLVTNFNRGVISHLVAGPAGAQLISTSDPRLTALGLPQYPHLPINTDPFRIEEIRRTVYIGNLDSTVPPDQVLKFFNDIGEVKYIRMAGDDTQPTRFAFVEYNHQSSIANALQHNGFILGSRALKINHSNNAIVKPPPKIQEVDDISKRLHESSRSISRDYNSRDRHQPSARYDRDRGRERDIDRYRSDRRRSPRRSHRSRSRSRSKERSSHRSSRKGSSRRSRSRSPRRDSSRRHKSSRH